MINGLERIQPGPKNGSEKPSLAETGSDQTEHLGANLREADYPGKKAILADFIGNRHAKAEDFLELLRITKTDPISQFSVIESIGNIKDDKELSQAFGLCIDNLTDLEKTDNEFFCDEIVHDAEGNYSELPDGKKEELIRKKGFLTAYRDESERDDDKPIQWVCLNALCQRMRMLGSLGEKAILDYLKRKRVADIEIERNVYAEPGDSKPINDHDLEYFYDEEGDLADAYDSYELGELHDVFFSEKQVALGLLADIGTEKSADFLAESMENDPDFVFLHKSLIAKVMNRQPEHSAGKLFDLIRKADEVSDQELRDSSLKVLLRIELGRIGISEEGLDYLESRYDLGEFNDPDFFARRLTGNGDIGIFDKERVLQRYFNVSGTVGQKGSYRPELLEFACKTLFVSGEGTTEEERKKRNGYLREFKEGYFGFYDDDFFEKTGIRFNDLSFREQGWFLLANKHADEDERSRIESFAKSFGEDGLRTFLSLEFDGKMGSKILSIGDSLEKRSAAEVFARYADIVDASERADKEVREAISVGAGISEEEVNRVRLGMLDKSRRLLGDFFEASVNGAASDWNSINERLAHHRTDLAVFTSIFKSFAKDNPEVSFEDFKGLSFETVSGKELGESNGGKDAERMIAIAERNYPDDQALRKLVVDSLREGLEKDNSEFYVLRRNGKAISFLRFDDEGDHYYAGSFNVDPDYRGSAIGEAMMRKAFDRKAAQKPLHGIADPGIAVCSKYVEDEGFVISGVDRSEANGQDVLGFEIVRDDRRNREYAYRGKSIDIRSEYSEQQAGTRSDGTSVADLMKTGKPFVMSFDREKETESFLATAERLMRDRGYVITRYAPQEKGGDRILAAFEPRLR